MKNTFPNGFLLAIEGIDGAGKSVQARAVATALEARGLDCLLTHEPTDGPWGRKLRESATRGRLPVQEELEAFLADRRQHVQECIRPALAAGRIVVTDRYYFSTVAYQGARGLDPAELLQLNEAFAVEPHLLVLLDLDPAAGRSRVEQRAGRANEFEALEELAKCRAIFLNLTKPYLVKLDARQSPKTVCDEILLAFAQAALRRLTENPRLSAREKLNASLALHGAPPDKGVSPHY